ncbi:MAG: Fe-S protein assembly chaperone HscA [Alphaproteobacteria bacterium GM7ARS4]|nr:Fe-S protein assembly chaperone HscA [Alphaproteobacteria bacterium GM7ARS4]
MALLQIHEPGETPKPHSKARDSKGGDGDHGMAIGIDLGTTRSMLAYVDGDKGAVHIVRDQQGGRFVPSVLCFHKDKRDNPIVIGAEAVAVMEQGGDKDVVCVSSVKRFMGRGIDDDVVKNVKDTLAYGVEGGGDDGQGMVRLVIGGRHYSPVALSSMILRFMREMAEASMAVPLRRAVITVPAYFDDAARLATKDAARLAGLEVLRLVNEPTAAALAYGLESGQEGLYAVYDFGGGTFDFSVLHLRRGVFQVLATGGDGALGGDDFDDALLSWCLEQGYEPSLTGGERHQQLMRLRAYREALTHKEHIEGENKAGQRYSLSRRCLEDAVTPLVERSLAICDGVLRDAQKERGMIEGVVLAGGVTRMPFIRKRVSAFFGKEALTSLDPDEVVVRGAALQAHALTRGAQTLLLDVCPLSLGLETMGGLTEKMIMRNTPLPVCKRQTFTTWQDGQTAMSLHIVQGEREMASDNRSLARFVLSSIPPMAAGMARIDVTLTIDVDGLLTVEAQEQQSGVKQSIEVKPSYGVSEDEMASMVRASITHARDDMAMRLGREARVEGERLALAVEKALASSGALCSDEERKTIEAALYTLKESLKQDKRDVIKEAITGLDEATQAFAQRRMEHAMAQGLRGKAVGDVAGEDETR